MTERRCSDCTLCCKLLPMKRDSYPPERVAFTAARMVEAGKAEPRDFAGMVLDFDKPAGQPCPHQRHHKGCDIYQRRPFGCRIWSCKWLLNDDTADLRRPDRSRYVIDQLQDYITLQWPGADEITVEVVQIWVDPTQPDAWRDPALLAYLERRGQEGKAALIRWNSTDAVTVFPPSMSATGQWHEIIGGTVREQHRGDELIEGIARARKIVWADG